MEFKDVILNRRSIRSFTSEEVNVNELKEIIRLSAYAPSINNSQPWEFIVIKNKHKLDEMAEAVNQEINSILKKDEDEKVLKKVEWYSTFFKDAPAVIAVIETNYSSEIEKIVNLSKQEINQRRKHPDIQSIGAVIQNILLTAYDFGYGTCWLSAPTIAGEKLNDIIGIDKDKNILAFVAIGKAKTNPKAPERKDIDTIFKVIE